VERREAKEIILRILATSPSGNAFTRYSQIDGRFTARRDIPASSIDQYTLNVSTTGKLVSYCGAVISSL
jgi:hypothetical protein